MRTRQLQIQSTCDDRQCQCRDCTWPTSTALNRAVRGGIRGGLNGRWAAQSRTFGWDGDGHAVSPLVITVSRRWAQLGGPSPHSAREPPRRPYVQQALWQVRCILRCVHPHPRHPVRRVGEDEAPRLPPHAAWPGPALGCDWAVVVRAGLSMPVRSSACPKRCWGG